MNNSACPEVLEEVAALPAASLARLAAARGAGEYSRFAAELSPETLGHLPSCDFCRAEIALLAGATETLGALPAPALPPDFAARVSVAIAELSQDVIASPESAPPDDAPAMIAPPLQRDAKRNWRGRFGLEKIGAVPRRNLKIAWASGSVLAAFVLVLATQIEPPAMLAPHSNSATSGSAPSPASTREETSGAKGAAAKSAAPALPQAPSKANATKKKIEAPSAAVSAPPAVPPTKSGGASTAREGLAPPSLPLQRAIPKPEIAPKNVTPQFAPPPKPRDATRKTSPSSDAARQKKAPATQPRVLAQSAPDATAARTSPMKSGKPQANRERAPRGALRSRPVPAGAAPQRDGKARTSTNPENFEPPAAMPGAVKSSEAAAPPSVASTRDEARSTPKMRGGSAAESSEAAAPNDSADVAVSASQKANARSGAFAEPAPAVRNRAATAPISLHIELAAPRDIKRARLRLELPRGAKLQSETPNNVIWSGALKRGENAVADVKIVEDETVSSHRARAVLESRERDGWRIVATKIIEWKAP